MLINRTKFIGAAILVAAVTFLSCNRLDFGEPATGPKNAVRFSSSINNGLQTKASNASWSLNDEIGVFMVGNGTADIVDNVANKRYITASGDGNFSASGDDVIFYPEDGPKVDFITYYPYQAHITTLGTYDVDVSDQSDPEAIDLLYARADNNGAGYDEDHASNVNLQFRHQLSKLQLVIINTASELGVTVQELGGITAEISGLKTTATFDLAEGTLSDGDDVAAFSLRKLSGGAAFDALVIPDAIAEGEVTVTFTAGEESWTWELPATTFEPGKSNTYQILLVEPPPIRGAHVVFSERIASIEDTHADGGIYRYVPTQDIETQEGDYLFVFAHLNDIRPEPEDFPIAPAEYESVRTMRSHAPGSGTSGGPRAGRLAYRIATGETTALGQWENTNGLVVVVVRGVIGVGNSIAHNGSSVADDEITFNSAGLDHEGEPRYTLAFVTGRDNRSVTAYNQETGFDPEDYTPYTFAGTNPTFWAAISKYANQTMPPLKVTFSQNNPRLLYVAVALESDDPVLENEPDPEP